MIDGPDGSAPAPAAPAPAPNPAPVAPAPAPAPEPMAPQIPRVPATEAAGASVREKLAKGGTFAQIFGSEQADAAAPDPANVDNPEGDEPDPAATAEGDEPDTDTESPVTGDEGAESEDELTVELPGRRAEDEALSITVDSPETAERLRQMANGYMRGEQVREERESIQRERQAYQTERAEFEDTLATDPVGLLSEALPPEVQAQVALSLLAQDGVLERLPDGITLEDLTDPDRLNFVRVQLENQRLRMKDGLQARAAARRKANENATQIRGVIDRIVEVGNVGDRADQFLSQAISDIRDYAQNTGIQYIDPNVLPILLAQRLKEYGMNPVEIAEALSGSGAETPPPRKKSGTAISGTIKPPAPKGAPASPQKTATQFVKQAQVRRKVAAAAPAGAGPAAVPLSPPPNQTIEERTAWHRQHRGVLRPS